MKLSRKLIPAFAMLLLSAVLMSTASFAWFSTNTQATATGMSVTVSSARNILISSDNQTFASSAEFNVAAAALEPASAVAKASPEFFYMETAGSGMTAENAGFGSNPVFAEATQNTHYITFTAYLKVVGEDAAGATIIPTITFSHTASPVYPALRVLFVVDNTTPYLYAPVGTPDADAKPIASIDQDGKPTAADTANTLLTNSTSPIVDSAAKEQVYEVDVYVWLEGQDKACTAANAVQLALSNITIDFKIPAA
jgi:hypothetical protein